MSEINENTVNFEELSFAQFVATARLYDVGMAILTHLNPQAAHDLINLHAQGVLFGPTPSFNGVFVSDEVSEAEQEASDGVEGY